MTINCNNIFAILVIFVHYCYFPYVLYVQKYN